MPVHQCLDDGGDGDGGEVCLPGCYYYYSDDESDCGHHQRGQHLVGRDPHLDAVSSSTSSRRKVDREEASDRKATPDQGNAPRECSDTDS